MPKRIHYNKIYPNKMSDTLLKLYYYLSKKVNKKSKNA